VEIEVIPFTRGYDLLLIDDFYLSDEANPLRNLPTETEHDEFWTGICSRAPGFNPIRDIYEADIYNRDAPVPLEVLAGYRNIVWTCDGLPHGSWSHTIVFDPLPAQTFPAPNNLRMFLAAGGSAFTCGRSDRNNHVLSATFMQSPMFPASITDDLTDYDYDEDFARYSMAHDDYYVTVIDKVNGVFRDDLPDGVIRNPDRDGMTMAINTGIEHDSYYDFPDTLSLWEEVTQPGMFFDPSVRGFWYVEVYDPQYYMDEILKESHECFTPLYAMRARSSLSAIDYATVAIRGTLGYDYYRDYYNYCERYRVSRYESFHFGLPLWFMDHDQVEQIADNIFQEWNIR
jgi:hypothetical protein